MGPNTSRKKSVLLCVSLTAVALATTASLTGEERIFFDVSNWRMMKEQRMLGFCLSRSTCDTYFTTLLDSYISLERNGSPHWVEVSEIAWLGRHSPHFRYHTIWHDLHRLDRLLDDLSDDQARELVTVVHSQLLVGDVDAVNRELAAREHVQ